MRIDCSPIIRNGQAKREPTLPDRFLEHIHR